MEVPLSESVDAFFDPPPVQSRDGLPPPCNEVECPITGEIVSIDDVDGLIDMFERVKELGDSLYSMQTRLRTILAAKTTGDAKTRRLIGRRRKVKVEMPDDSWENAKLMEAFNSYPQYRDQCLKISTIKVMMREYKKIVGTSGPPDFEQFKSMVEGANRGPVGTPTIKIEG